MPPDQDKAELHGFLCELQDIFRVERFNRMHYVLTDHVVHDFLVDDVFVFSLRPANVVERLELAKARLMKDVVVPVVAL